MAASGAGSAAARLIPRRPLGVSGLDVPLLGIGLATTPPTADPWARGAAFTAGAVLVVWLWLACWARCCALMMRDAAMSSMARVIFLVDSTERIRRRSSRVFAMFD